MRKQHRSELAERRATKGEVELCVEAEHNAHQHPTNNLKAVPIVWCQQSPCKHPFCSQARLNSDPDRKWFHIQHPPQTSSLRWPTFLAADLPDQGIWSCKGRAGSTLGPVFGCYKEQTLSLVPNRFCKSSEQLRTWMRTCIFLQCMQVKMSLTKS